MRLAAFIRHAEDDILAESIEYAGQIPALNGSALAVLRDHLPIVLETIARDLERPQSDAQSIEKSLGNGPTVRCETAAQTHGTLRARSGLDIEQLVAEYRVLRSCVLRLWAREHPEGGHVIEDTMRFNEAIDQAVAESVAFYAQEKEKWRNLFLAVLGHDLRDPLNAMLLTAQLLERGGDAAHLASALGRNGRRLKTLLDSLLEYTRMTLGAGLQIRREPVDLAAECQEEVEILQQAFPHRQFAFHTRGDTRGRYDSSRVRQAVANLLSNAAQHSPADCPISITIAGGHDTVEISTQNLAAPLPQEVLDALFEPLRRNPGNEEGASTGHLGLGLFVVREIAQAHQGQVGASMEDGSIRFTMVLPKSP